MMLWCLFILCMWLSLVVVAIECVTHEFLCFPYMLRKLYTQSFLLSPELFSLPLSCAFHMAPGYSSATSKVVFSRQDDKLSQRNRKILILIEKIMGVEKQRSGLNI